MAVWKQVVICLVVLVAAVAGWAWFFPGASTILARHGIHLPFVVEAENGATGRASAGSAGAAPPTIVAVPVTRATINNRFIAIGTGQARQSVSLTPYSSGRMVKLLVRPGAHVEAGDVVAKLDSEAEQIARDRAQIALADAEDALKRVTALKASNTATNVQVSAAQLAVENARLALRDAQLTLDRRSVLAPISGVVGILPVDEGNYVSTQTVIATIDDRSRILVDFWVPERYAGAITVGSNLTATSVARPDEVFQGSVVAVDNRIDPASRTLHVRANIDNPTDTLRAGMAFEVMMRFPGDTFPAVDPLAIQWGTEGAFVWAVRAGKADRTPVKIIQRNTDSVLVDARLAEGDLVVTEGILMVRPGAEVKVASVESRRDQPVPIVTAPRGSGS